MYRKIFLIFLLSIAVFPGVSQAQSTDSSPRSWFFELKAGRFTPNVDDEFSGSGPFKTIFGDNDSILYNIQMDYLFFKKFGSLGVGFKTGFYRIVGKALDKDGNSTEDETTLILMPNGINLTYRFDLLAQKWNIPLVPFARAGLNYTLWWITEGDGSIATFKDEGHGGSAAGATYGYEFGLGLSLLLDFFDPEAANTLEDESGVNNSYIFAEYVWNFTDNFGGSNALMVGGNYWLFGIGLEF